MGEEATNMKMTLKLVLIALVAHQCYAFPQTDEVVPEMTYSKDEPVDAFTIVAESDELIENEGEGSDFALLQQEQGSGEELIQQEEGSGFSLLQQEKGSGEELIQQEEGSGFSLLQEQGSGGEHELIQQEEGSG